jgi:hypothetical protein
VKKIMLMCLIVVFAFAGKPQKTVEPAFAQIPVINTDADLTPEVNPLLQQMFQARHERDWTAYKNLFQLYESQISLPGNDAPAEVELKPEDYPGLRWNGDRIIYSGNVLYNSWAVSSDIDDEAISVDHYKGDTLRAAVVVPDSTIWVFQSNDGGRNWSAIMGWSTGTDILEPEIINDPNGRFYHVFQRRNSNNGDVRVITDSINGGWYGTWIENTADTVTNYTVCSDRAQYDGGYYLFCAYHRTQGGVGSDQILISTSVDYGLNWSTPSALQGSGSGYPDLTFADNDYLYETYYARLSGGNKVIYTRRSSNEGSTWFGSVQILSDTTTKQGPQIAAAHDGSGDAWVIFPKRDAATAYNDYGNVWSWSQDYGATWSTAGFVNSWADYMEFLPSISIYDASGNYYPSVTYIRSYYDFTNPVVRSFNWQADSTWSADTTWNDSVPAFTRPISTWETVGAPAIAYVGAGGVNVYFDSWSMTPGAEEGDAGLAPGTILMQSRPNPFLTSTLLEYNVPVSGKVSLKIYNSIGREVANLVDEYKVAGAYTFSWDGLDKQNLNLPRGIYFAKLQVGKMNASRKIIVR